MQRLIPRGQAASPWSRPDSMPEPLHRLLLRRGVESYDEAQAFLYPQLNQLHDPMSLSCMAEAVALVREAQTEKWKITVFGDYDVDGVCASSILYLYLTSLGLDVEVYLPSRHREGYGLNEQAVKAIAQRAQLLITVDCGISSLAEVALAQQLGLQVVVTDHHTPGAQLPSCPVVNPLLGGYPYRTLCGAGVAFKLVEALGGRSAAEAYLDLAALATIADVVPLTGENRVITKLGLQRINAAPRPGLEQLAGCAGLSGRTLSSGNIAFQIAPRLNASGRIGDARRAFELLTGQDAALLSPIAQELEQENLKRKAIEGQMLSEALSQMEGFDFLAHRILVLEGQDWNPGVIGLTASRLVEKYHYPVILLAREGETCVGSCRSIPGVDIFQALTSCADLFTRYGGHRQAAGLTLPACRVEELRRRLDAHLSETIDPEAYIPVAEYDLELQLSELSEAFVHSLDLMQPTGFGNPAPVFLSEVTVAAARGVGKESAHLKLSLQQGNRYVDGIFFRMGGLASALRGARKQALFSPQLNSWNGRASVQLELKALAPVAPERALEGLGDGYEALLRAFLTDSLYNREYSPLDGEQEPETLSLAQLRQLLAAGVQGVLMVALTPEGAQRALTALDARCLDLCLGGFPQDERLFNALCLCPTGAPPMGYTHLVWLDGWMPLEWERPFRSRGALYRAQLGAAVPESPLLGLPDVDGLRALYCAARTPLPADALLARLAQAAHLSACGALAGLCCLDAMELISFAPEPPGLSLRPARKCCPLDNPAFQRLSCLRNSVLSE